MGQIFFCQLKCPDYCIFFRLKCTSSCELLFLVSTKNWCRWIAAFFHNISKLQTSQKVVFIGQMSIYSSGVFFEQIYECTIVLDVETNCRNLQLFEKKKVQMFAFKKGRFQVFDMQTCLRVSWQPTLDNSLPENGTSTAPQVQHNQLTLKWAWDAFQAKRPKNPVWTTNRCLCKIMERIRVVSNRVLHSNPQLSNGCVSDGIANVTKPGYTT